MSNKKVSLIVPCYNQAEYLDECLQSVLDQTFSDWECIIVNDGSPDNTDEIAQKWIKLDSRFKYLKLENGGVANARNKGIEKSEGEWILPLDADDMISPNYLLLASAYFPSDPKLIYGMAELIGEKNEPWNLEKYSYRKLLNGNIIYVTAFFKKSTWEKSRKFDSNLKTGLEDWDFWIDILNPNDEIYFISEVVFYYRIKSNSRNKSIHENENNITFIKEYIVEKHQSKYNVEFGDYLRVVSKLIVLERENKSLKKILESKRFKLGYLIGDFTDQFRKTLRFKK